MSTVANTRITYTSNNAVRTINGSFPIEHLESVKQCILDAGKPPAVTPAPACVKPAEDIVPFYKQPSNLLLFILFLVCIIVYLLIQGSPFKSEQVRMDV
jgi:hypothetical protein